MNDVYDDTFFFYFSTSIINIEKILKLLKILLKIIVLLLEMLLNLKSKMFLFEMYNFKGWKLIFILLSKFLVWFMF